MTKNKASRSHAPNSPTASQRRRVCMAVDTVARNDVRVMRAARALAQTGIAVTIVDVARKRRAASQEQVEGMTIRHIAMPSWYVSTRFKLWFLVKYAALLMRCALRLVFTSTDVYHAHDQQILPACWFAALVRRKPLVFDAHEIPLSDPVLTRWSKLRGMSSMALRRMLRRCAAIIVVSPLVVEEIKQHFGGPKAVLVRNVAPYHEPVTSDRLRQHFGLLPDTGIALYQGYLLPSRELERLVQVARYLPPNIVIVLMGDGPTRDMLQAEIEREGVQERIHLLPAVPYEELLEWTASADLGLIIYRPDVSSNIKTNLPNKLFEFMVAGVPVLSSDLPAVADILVRYQTGCMVESLNPETIARAIASMLDDRGQLAAMRENSYAACARHLRWEIESKKLVQFYDELLATPSEPQQGVHHAA